MTFVLTEDQEAIVRSARGFARERTPVAHFRALRDANDPVGFSRDVWREMGGLGFAGLTLPERVGGAALGLTELGLVVEELGRQLAPTPLLSTLVLAGGALALAGEGYDAALTSSGAGERVFALAHEEKARFAPFAVTTRAESVGGGFVLRGEKSFVLDGHVADGFVVAARTSGADADRAGITLFYVDAKAQGVSSKRLALVDSRNVASVRFDGARAASVVGEVDRGADILERVLDRATATLSAEILGGMQEAFDRTIAYLKTRTQFGVPIGSFQALKHRAAQLYCEIELTRSLVLDALRAHDANRDDASLVTSAAKARASETFRLVANEAVQMHGGVGVTDELDIGLFLKRAAVAAETLGSASYHRDRFAKLRGY
jgi:alkylation response protein AidB-like acyl-CoA dehydrogenase